MFLSFYNFLIQFFYNFDLRTIPLRHDKSDASIRLLIWLKRRIEPQATQAVVQRDDARVRTVSERPPSRLRRA